MDANAGGEDILVNPRRKNPGVGVKMTREVILASHWSILILLVSHWPKLLGPGGLRQDQLGPGGGGHGGHQAVGQGRRDTQQVIIPLVSHNTLYTGLSLVITPNTLL